MKPIVFTLLIIFGTIVVIGLGSVLLVLWAYVVGQVLLRILPADTFSAFEATMLNLVGVLIVGMMVIRLVSSAISNPLSSQTLSEDDGDDEYLDYDDDADEEELEDAIEDELQGIPLWRRPLKNNDFTDAKPNDRCPCGSGRKFKNCHGYKRAKVG
jgi:hypothetical protein